MIWYQSDHKNGGELLAISRWTLFTFCILIFTFCILIFTFCILIFTFSVSLFIYNFLLFYFLQWWYDIRVAAKVVPLWVGGSAISRCMSDPKERFPIPYPATHSIAPNWSLCIMLHVLWDEAGRYEELFPLNWRVPLEKNSDFLATWFYLFIQSYWPSIKVTIAHAD